MTLRMVWLTTVCGLLVLTGCGYNFQGKAKSNLPKSIKRIYVPIFSNKTLEQGIEIRVTDSIRKVILNDGRVTLASGIDTADAVLDGQVTSFQLRAIGFSKKDRAEEIRLRLGVRVVLRDTIENKTIFGKDIVSDREYRVSSSLGTNQLKKIKASELASDELARELQSLMIEGF